MASRSPASRRNAQNALKLKEQVRKRASAATSPVEMEKLEPSHRRAAGLDIGSAENYVAVPPETMPPGESPVRVFGVVREQQDTWVEWLRTCQISTAAREATGIYWLTLYDKLEAAGIEGCLVDPHGVKAVPGRKSDWMDCQWLQKLPACGLLPRAFRPDAPLRRLRTLTRPRAEWVCAAASQQQHREKARVCLNLQLGLVVSDLVGETGRAIIRAILAGERDPQVLVEPRNARGTQASLQEMKQARRGPYREEHLFVLQQSVDGWDFLQKQTQACDAKIELARVRGLNLLSVLMLLGEMGTAMSRWRSAQAFCSWLGLCPGARIRGGKVLSRRTRKVNNRAATLLRMAAVGGGELTPG